MRCAWNAGIARCCLPCGFGHSAWHRLLGMLAGPAAAHCPVAPLPGQMGCTFCATGTMGLIADLTAGEIVEQLVHATRVAAGCNAADGGGSAVATQQQAQQQEQQAGQQRQRLRQLPIHNVVFMVRPAEQRWFGRSLQLARPAA